MISIRQNILNIVAYFDIFHYPVTDMEIQSFLNREVHLLQLRESLQLLLGDKSLYKLGEFYALRNDSLLAIRRMKGNIMAIEEMKHAYKAAKILSKFPYIRGLAISGSLSKNFADENTDVDFFIITAAGRLWIARTLLQLFYKLAAVAGKRRWFCLNYYIDEQELEIPEKNIFTAMEIVTLVPMQGGESLQKFFNANKWTGDYFPMHHTKINGTPQIAGGVFSKMVEQLFNRTAGDTIDNWLMKITQRRWQQKVLRHKVNEKGIYIGMMVDRHFSKPDPKNFQHKILAQYQLKLSHLTQNKISQVVN